MSWNVCIPFSLITFFQNYVTNYFFAMKIVHFKTVTEYCV